jgi:hypothetical protein
MELGDLKGLGEAEQYLGFVNPKIFWMSKEYV